MTVRIGAGQGFSGDDLRGLTEVLHEGVDYVCCEALAEFTLVGMQRERQRDERLGYSRDIAAVADLVLPAVEKGQVRLVTNAGALNPLGARRAVADVAHRLDVDGLRVGVVLGSDLTGHLGELIASGADLRHADTGEELDSTEDTEFAVAYLGAYPIVEALAGGAQVVITGRVADTSVFMGPAIFELGVEPNDWMRLGRLAVMGHLLECSTQVSGGNFSGPWWEVPGLDAIGFPIAEVVTSGESTITKPGGSGGLVSVDTVKEQLLYEVGDPRHYMTPDVVADMTSTRLEDGGTDRVLVVGATGYPASDTYKVTLSKPAGWTAAVGITYTAPHALAKACAARDVLERRLKRASFSPLETWVEFLGAGGLFGETEDEPDLPEVTLRYAARCSTPQEASMILHERIAGLSISGPPGAAASGMGTSPPIQASQIWPALVPKELVDPHVRVVIEDL